MLNKKGVINMDKNKLEDIKDMVNCLGWDYKNMTTGGKQTYRRLCLSLGLEFEWEEIVPAKCRKENA